MIDLAVELLMSLVFWLLLASWRALPIFLLALALNFFTKGYIAPRYRCLLWMIVLARLMLPFSIESSVSMHVPTNQILASAGFVNTTAPEPISDAANPTEMTPVQNPYAWARAEDTEPTTAYATKSPSVAEDTSSTTAYGPIEAAVILAIAIWPIGGLILMFRSAVKYCRFAYHLRKCATLSDQRKIDLLLRVCDSMGHGRRPNVRIVTDLEVPAVFGVFRPTICLPKSSLAQNEAELQLVFAHEVAHAKRRDGFVLIFAEMIRAIHWINPMAWMAYSRLHECMEQSADEAVLRHQPSAEPDIYSELLLSFSRRGSDDRPTASMGLLFSAPGKILKRRLELLSRVDVQNHWISIGIAIVAILSISAIGLTDSRTISPPTPQKRINIPSMQPFAFQPGPVAVRGRSQAELGDVKTKTYDVHSAINRIKELNRFADPHAELKSWLCPLVMLGPGFEDWEPSGNVLLEENKLTVEAPEKIHDSIEQQLQLVSRAGLCQIALEWRVIHCPLEIVKQYQFHWNANEERQLADDQNRLGLDLATSWANDLGAEDVSRQTVVPNGPPLLSTKISQEQIQDLIANCQADHRSNLLQMPRVTLFNGQSATIQDESYLPFVTNVVPASTADSEPWKPVIDIVSDGLRIDMKVEVTDEQAMALQCKFTQSNIMDVDLANLPLGDTDQTITVQVPRTIRDETSLRCTLGTNEGVLVACPIPFSRDELQGPAVSRLFLVTAKIIRDFD